MNLQPAEAAGLVRTIADAAQNAAPGVELIVCPPAVYLPLALNEWQRGSALPVGAQNCHWEKSGAYTGEVSPEMLNAIGVSHCIVGHSERRSLFGETDEDVARKVEAVINAGMQAICCCGETLEEREAERQEEVVGAQLRVALGALSPAQAEHLIIAYEPVWAIGTGETASSQQAQAMHAFIRSGLEQILGSVLAENIPVLYGGSCKPDNAAELFAQPDVDGGLIGGASLNADDFLAIARAF